MRNLTSWSTIGDVKRRGRYPGPLTKDYASETEVRDLHPSWMNSQMVDRLSALPTGPDCNASSNCWVAVPYEIVQEPAMPRSARRHFKVSRMHNTMKAGT